MKVKFDGYAFGDRILEDVYFQADIADDGTVSNVVIDPDDDGDYWSDLNQAKWLKMAKEYLEETLRDECDNNVQDLIDNDFAEIV